MNNKCMKKIAFLAFTCVILVSMLCGFALADVIFEPEDDFYNSHSSECEYVNRDYYANGESGFTELFTKPNGSSLGFADNGELFHVQFTYKQGDELWGLAEYSESGSKLIARNGDTYKTAWIKISDMSLKYDYISFDEAHSSEYKNYDGDYSELTGATNIVMWTFPNSGESSGSIDKADENLTFTNVYTDIDGAQWGFVSYYYGMKNFWICLSDPSGTEKPAIDVPAVVLNSPEPNSEPESTANDMSTVIIICVAAAMLCSAAALALLKKKKN
ncbi:MAG: hypothetical protein EOM51_08885 [Clostridia bacterium]|nr:hypothetical protein [Clostridia bacterium]